MSFIETSKKVYKDVVESMSANLIKKAKEIAAKMAGSYSNAVREIEKLQKNLSNHPEVKKALMLANEETLDTFTKEEITEKIKPFMISYSKNGQHAGFEDGDSLADIQNKAASLRKKGFTIDKMGRYNPPVKKEEEEIEEGIKPYVSMQRDQATGKMNYVVLDKDEKEVFRSSDQRVATDYWKKNFDKLKESNYIDLKGRMTDSQIANVKKVWSGKTKADLTQGIKDMISKMDPITKLGIKQAKINVLSDLIEATMSPQMISILKREYEPMRGKKITAARARQLMNILDKLDDKNLELLAKQNIPFVSSGSQSKLSVRRMGVKITNFNPMGSFKEDMDYSETDLCEFKKMTVTFKDKKDMEKAKTDLAKTGFKVTAIGNDLIGNKLHIDGKGADLNKYATDMKNFYKASVRAESYIIDESADEDFYNPVTEACWTGYKQVGMKDKGGKKVPNCVPEDNEIEEGKIKDIFTANKEGESISQIAKRLKISLSTVKSILGEAISVKAFKNAVDPSKKGLEISKTGGMSGMIVIKDKKELKDLETKLAQAKRLYSIKEADLSKSQIKKVHKMADDLPKKDFRDRYGKEKGDAVRYGTATNMVKKKLGMKEEKRLYVEMIAGLKKKSEKSGMPYGILKKVYDRGMAAWKGGHRPGASQQQWAFARVNSFITKSSGTWGGADKDLAAKVKGK